MNLWTTVKSIGINFAPAYCSSSSPCCSPWHSQWHWACPVPVAFGSLPTSTSTFSFFAKSTKRPSNFFTSTFVDLSISGFIDLLFFRFIDLSIYKFIDLLIYRLLDCTLPGCQNNKNYQFFLTFLATKQSKEMFTICSQISKQLKHKSN